MGTRRWAGLVACLPLVGGGCGPGKAAVAPEASRVRADDLIGRWRLVRAGGEPPAAVDIRALWLDIAADGTWSSEAEMQGRWAGMGLKGGGTWALADEVVSYI